MKFTKQEKVLLNMYAYVEREESIEAFQKLLTRCTEAEGKSREMLGSVRTKLSQMTDQQYDQIEFYPDELISMFLEKSVEEVTMQELPEVVDRLVAEFSEYAE